MEIKKTKNYKRNKITYTVDESLNKLKGRNIAPKKLEEANKLLRKLKSPLPK